MSKRSILLISFSVLLIIGLGIFLRLKWLQMKCPPSTYYCKENLDNKISLTAKENEIQVDLSLLGDEWLGQAICEYYLTSSKGKVDGKKETIHKVHIQQCNLTDERYSQGEIHKATILLRDSGIFRTGKGNFIRCTYYFPSCRVNFYNPLDW